MKLYPDLYLCISMMPLSVSLLFNPLFPALCRGGRFLSCLEGKTALHGSGRRLDPGSGQLFTVGRRAGRHGQAEYRSRYGCLNVMADTVSKLRPYQLLN